MAAGIANAAAAGEGGIVPVGAAQPSGALPAAPAAPGMAVAAVSGPYVLADGTAAATPAHIGPHYGCSKVASMAGDTAHGRLNLHKDVDAREVKEALEAENKLSCAGVKELVGAAFAFAERHRQTHPKERESFEVHRAVLDDVCDEVERLANKQAGVTVAALRELWLGVLREINDFWRVRWDKSVPWCACGGLISRSRHQVMVTALTVRALSMGGAGGGGGGDAKQLHDGLVRAHVLDKSSTVHYVVRDRRVDEAVRAADSGGATKTARFSGGRADGGGRGGGRGHGRGQGGGGGGRGDGEAAA